MTVIRRRNIQGTGSKGLGFNVSQKDQHSSASLGFRFLEVFRLSN